MGIGSENAAHRIAVDWETTAGIRRGVYIPRRDTNSRLNTLAGGTVFPGIHHHARFDVVEADERFSVTMHGDDGQTHVHVSGRVAPRIPDDSVFESTDVASKFFEEGSLGYSDTRTEGRFDGLELRCGHWSVEPLDVDEVRSSYFEDPVRFPAGSVTFDCALLMRGIDHEWHGHPDLCCPTATTE